MCRDWHFREKMEEQQGIRIIRIVLDGVGGTGKTALVQRLCTNSFPKQYNGTMGHEVHSVEKESADGRKFRIDLVDTSGVDVS